MNRAQAIVALVAVGLAVALVGMGLYAENQPGRCTKRVPTTPLAVFQPEPPFFIDRSDQPTPPFLCAEHEATAFTEQAARWWFIVAGAVLAVGIFALPRAGRRR